MRSTPTDLILLKDVPSGTIVKKPNNGFVALWLETKKLWLKRGVDRVGNRVEVEFEPYLSITGTDNEDGTGSFAVQVKKWNGDNPTDAYLLRVWFDDASLGAPTDLGTLTVDTGTLVKEETDDAVATVATDATGLAEITLDLTTDDTVYLHAAIIGKLTIAELAISGNS